MMRSLFSGVTGLRSHQTKMDVLSNNISNVNTLGFKKSATTFADLYSETISPSSAPSANAGGTNAKQVGLGVNVSSVVIKHTPGAPQYTGAPLDLCISGDGFFAVRTADGPRYTRAGNFTMSSSGALVNPNGYFVQTYNSIYNAGTEGKVGSVIGFENKSTNYFDTFKFDAAAEMKGVNAGEYTFKVDTTTGDVRMFKNEIDVTPAGGLSLNNATAPIAGGGTKNMADIAALVAGEVYTLTIPNFGKVSFSVPTNVPAGVAGDGTSRFKDLAKVLNNSSINIQNNDGFFAGTEVGDLVVDMNKFYNISVDERGAVVGQLRQDETNPIPGTGDMKKGEKVVLGYVALANFTNTEGLEKVATNLYSTTQNSGRATMGLPGQGGTGAISPSSLEMSNVDLSEEMVNMIITQRGFQANSRIITTTDQMLEELVNLKR